MKPTTLWSACRLIFVFTFCMAVLVGCADTPVAVAPEEEAPADVDLTDLQTLGIDVAELGGIDVAAIARAVNLEAVAALLDPLKPSPEEFAGKHGSLAFTVVAAGTRIQDAVDAAAPGDILLIEPGVYRESIFIDKPLSLIGWPWADAEAIVIENPGEEENGITARGFAGLVLANFTVRDFEDNGVITIGVAGYLMLHLTAIDNGEYGLFPVRSDNGILAFCTATGSADAGLYIGQSENVALLFSTAYGNVLGIEIENSTRVAVLHNKSYRNTAGFLGVLLPPSRFITVLESSDMQVAHNEFTHNNLENFADPDDFAAVVPSGSGLLIVGFDQTLITRNWVTDNHFIGIGVGSTATFGAITGIDITGIEPNPDNVTVRRNVAVRNGLRPPEDFPLPLPGVDLLWDGTGTGNCWFDNIADTRFPPDLPVCHTPS